MTKFFCIFIFFTIFLFSAFAENNAGLRTGDLIFQVDSETPYSKAIKAATIDDGSTGFVHVGIVAVSSPDSIFIIEASPSKGVVMTSIKAFIDSAPLLNGLPGLLVKRLQCDFNADEVVKRAVSMLGQPYDWTYLPDNGALYCSELIYDTYFDRSGKRIFEAKPMNFLDSQGVLSDFWIKLFECLDMEVPQGVLGTNPNDIGHDERLKEVFRYF